MLNFPTSPTSGDYYSFGVRTWQWNNSAWVIIDGAINASTLSGRDLNYILDAGNMTGTYTGVVSGSVTTGQVVNLEEFVEDTIGVNFILFGTGLSGTYNDAGNTFTISGKYASTTEHGVARFSSSDFTVTGGLVTVNDGGINIVSTQVSDFTEAVQDVVGSSSFLVGKNGVTGVYSDASNTLTLSGIDATYTTKGVASFNSSQFSVTAGAVSLGIVPYTSIESNFGPYFVGLSSVGLDASPGTLSTDVAANMLSNLLAITGRESRKIDNVIDFSTSVSGTWNSTGYYYYKTFCPITTATGSVLIHLPSPTAASGRMQIFKKVSSDVNTISISGNPYIDGDRDPFVLYKQWDAVTLLCGQDSWYVTAYHFE